MAETSASVAQTVANTAETAPVVKKEKPLLLVDGVDPFQSKEVLDNPPKPPHWTSTWPGYSSWVAKKLYIESWPEQAAIVGSAVYFWPKYIQYIGRTRAFEKYIVEKDPAIRRSLVPKIGIGAVGLRVHGRELNAMYHTRRFCFLIPVFLFSGLYMHNLFRRGREEDYWGAGKRKLARDALNNGKTPEETVDLLRDYMEERSSGAKSERLYKWYDDLAEIRRQRGEVEPKGLIGQLLSGKF